MYVSLYWLCQPVSWEIDAFFYVSIFLCMKCLTYIALNVLQFYRFALTTLTCKLHVNFWWESPSIKFDYPGLISADMGLTFTLHRQLALWFHSVWTCFWHYSYFMSISSKLLLMMSTLVNQLTDQAVIPSSENFFLQKQSVTFNSEVRCQFKAFNFYFFTLSEFLSVAAKDKSID